MKETRRREAIRDTTRQYAACVCQYGKDARREHKRDSAAWDTAWIIRLYEGTIIDQPQLLHILGTVDSRQPRSELEIGSTSLDGRDGSEQESRHAWSGRYGLRKDYHILTTPCIGWSLGFCLPGTTPSLGLKDFTTDVNLRWQQHNPSLFSNLTGEFPVQSWDPSKTPSLCIPSI
jgi:hypothetical protein